MMDHHYDPPESDELGFLLCGGLGCPGYSQTLNIRQLLTDLFPISHPTKVSLKFINTTIMGGRGRSNSNTSQQ